MMMRASTSFVAPRALGARAADVRGRGRVTVYSENMFDRFFRVVKSNANGMLNSMEDPEKVLDQAVDEMQGDLIKVRQSYAEVLATQRRMQTQKAEQDRLSAEWYKRAELAVEKGDDNLAKEALSRRQASVDKGKDLANSVAMMSGNVEKLFDSVKSLEEKIVQCKDEKELLIARSRTAKTTSQINEMLSDVGTGSASNAFDRMKEKVEQLETRAEVSTGLLGKGGPQGRSLEEQFKALESGNAVDDELARMKGSKALPSGGASALDKELEEMRKKMREKGE